MVRALERAGHETVLYLRDQHGWSIDQHRTTIHSWWPEVNAEIRNFDGNVEDCHAIFATGWESAWALLTTNAKGLRCYFVQDFEPSFYAAGSEYLLAEATYRFGFFGVTVGSYLGRLLKDQYNMEATHLDFGCDLDDYSLNNDSTERRQGICYYCRPSTPRRAHEVAVAALKLFSKSHPGVPIHFYGEPVGALPFEVQHHGLLSPRELGDLYNKCIAGLVLSATNVSLVPYEMLAAGCIPVVNDAPHNREVLDNNHVKYSGATPYEIAAALTELVSSPAETRRQRSKEASQSVSSSTWRGVEEKFVQIVQSAVADRTQLCSNQPTGERLWTTDQSQAPC
ncbi:MAG: hypothetical protein QM650_08385 [Microlunatus sp.]